MSEGGEVSQFNFVVAGNPVSFADRGHHLGLLHGIDTQVCLKVEIQIEHVHRIAGLFGYQGQHPLLYRIAFRSGAGGVAARARGVCASTRASTTGLARGSDGTSFKATQRLRSGGGGRLRWAFCVTSAKRAADP